MPDIKELDDDELLQLIGDEDSGGGRGGDAPADVSAGGMPAEAAQEGEDVGQGVRKVVLTPGAEGSGKPVLGATVFAHYRAWVRSTGSKIFDTWEEQQQLEMTLGSGIRAMQRSERALLHVPYALAYGEEGSFSFPSVPPKADLVYEVVLNGFDNPQEGRKTANLTVEDRIASADKRRLAGNEHFREGRLEDALLEYDMALGYMGQDFMMQMFGKYRDMANAVRLPCLLNAAACQLKLSRYQEAIGLCSEVLAEDKDNAKALFRRGKARIALGHTEKASEDLRQAQKLAPGDAAIKAALGEIRREEAQRREGEKRLFQGMFSSSASASASGSPAQGSRKGGVPAKRPLWKAVWDWIQRLLASLARLFGRPKRD